MEAILLSGLNFMTINQLVAEGPTKEPLLNMQESRVQFVVSECKTFLYEIDNWAKNSIDTMFGGGIIESSPASNIISKFVLLLLIALWIYLVVLYVVNVKKDHDYSYYYHEDQHMYMKVFKWFTPVFILIPFIGLFIGTHTANTALKNTNQPTAQVQLNAKAFNNYQSKPFDDDNQRGLDGLSNKDADFIHKSIAEGKATSIAYSDVQAQSNIQTNRKHRYRLVVVSEPHFKLSAYKNPKKVGAYIYAVYGMLVSLVGIGALMIWHSNSANDQW